MAYWLYDWIDANGITKCDRARNTLTDPVLERSLRDCATAAESVIPLEPAESDKVLLAGEGLDPAGESSCYEPSCADLRIRGVALRVALYFDSVVLHDPFLVPVRHDWDTFSQRVKKGRLEDFINLLLHLRQIGAEPFLSFSPKPRIARESLYEAAKGLGLDLKQAGAESLFREVSKECKVDISDRAPDGYVKVILGHPDLGTRFSVLYKTDGSETLESIRFKAVRVFLLDMVGALVADVAASRVTRSVVGMTSTVHRRLASQIARDRERDIAFRLDLPVLDGLSAEDLLSVRNEHQDEFKRCKMAIRRAVVERVSLDHDNVDVAAEIKGDVIDPEIQRISDRLKAAESVLKKKTALGVGVGAISTTCGLILGMGAPAVAAGIAAMIGVAGAAGAKHIEETSAIARSDLYYLWRLTTRA